MNKIWYISPSNQSANIGAGNYGSEKKQMNLLADEIIPHLDRAGVSFHRGDPDMSIQERARESNDMNAVFHLALHSNAGGNADKVDLVTAFENAGVNETVGDKF